MREESKAACVGPEVEYEAHPVSDRCREALETRCHAVLGVSPFNSYFSEDRIRSLARWASASFRSFHVFVPDQPAAYTLEALGYPPSKATQKAKRQGNYLHNKIRRAMLSLGFTPEETTERVVGWERLEAHPRYRASLEECTEFFEVDEAFRELCLGAAKWVLDKRIPGGGLDPTHLGIAARYFLTEIPLFTDSVGLFGTAASVFCYHQTIPFLEELYRGRMPMVVSAGQGFVRLEEVGPVGHEAHYN